MAYERNEVDYKKMRAQTSTKIKLKAKQQQNGAGEMDGSVVKSTLVVLSECLVRFPART